MIFKEELAKEIKNILLNSNIETWHGELVDGNIDKLVNQILKAIEVRIGNEDNS